MKKSGILNARLSGALARLGHTDTVVIADCGLPIPHDVEVIDLALVFGVPRFIEVLDAVRDEIVVESVVAAHEAVSTPAGDWLDQRFDDVEHISHAELKERVHDASVVVRSGETTSYANVILQCGVPF